MSVDWGVFSPDDIASSRRQQTLEISSVVRHYNDRSVPGLGGISYGMPMAWSLLGISLAEECFGRPLPSANAVEALVMSRALSAGGTHMRRGSGHRKLAGRVDFSFKALSARGAYVTQPLRMGTVQPLVQLGFVAPAPQRFNLYRLSDIGAQFLESFVPEKRALLDWARGEGPPLLKKLWPSQQLPVAAAQLLSRQLQQFGDAQSAKRRRALLYSAREKTFARSPLDELYPREQLDSAHWQDLRSGIALIRLRDAAILVLGRVEQQIGADQSKMLQPEAAVAAAGAELKALASAARVMLAEYDTSPGDGAHEFARLCAAPPAVAVMGLARRDGAVVRVLPGGSLGLGPAGKDNKALDAHDPISDRGAAVETEEQPLVPELPRIAHLYSLAADIEPSRATDR